MNKSNSVAIGAVAALLVPWIERLTGVKLTEDQALSLVILLMSAAHMAVAVFTRYFPPPNPQKPADPAKV